MAENKPDLAVLIDAENIPASAAEPVLRQCETLGRVVLRRAYGDFTNPTLAWTKDVLQRHAILPQQQFCCSPGKNAADIALVIDAMDLLHAGRFGGFCLVSSDSDFSRLALRLREAGQMVYGFGETKSNAVYQAAFTQFVTIEGGPAQVSSGVAQLIHGTLAIAPMAEEGWVAIAELGSLLRARAPEFRPKTYGSAKLSTLLRKIPGIEVETSGQRCRAQVMERKRA